MALRIKRLAASISAGIEDVVTKLENHEAVADCLLEDLRSGIAQMRVQRSRIDIQAKRTAAKLAEAQADHARWNERALQLADSDEGKALQCIQRGEYCERTATNLQEQQQSQQDTVSELDSRIADMESQLGDLTLKRASLSSRELSAKSNRTALSQEGVQSASQLFDRWEAAVMTDEYAGGHGTADGLGATDQLEREFSEVEKQAALKAKLAALKAEQRRGES